MEKNSDTIAIYSRKSRFTGKGESIGNQVDMCRAYIRTAFGEAYADQAAVFEDEGFSGGNLNRPDFKRMMQAARAHQFRAVVVYRLDRISRSISDFSALIEELGRLGIAFVSIRESFDTSSPMGRAMMYIASVFSQLERETIAERIRDNMHELAKTGRWLGGVTPTGYTSEAVETVTVDGKNKRACCLKLLPEEAAIVRVIYHLYAETDSLTRTETELLRRGCKTKNDRNFTRFSIKSILQNPVYMIADREAYRYFKEQQAELFSPPEEFDGVRGILAYNRTDQEKGRAAIFLPISRWIISVGQHPGLIPAHTWIQVQKSLELNRCKAYRKPRSNQALLTGLLWCRCGSRMYPKLTQRMDIDGKPLFRYVCKQKEHSRRSLCSLDNAEGNSLDAALWEQIKSLEGDPHTFVARLEQGQRFFADGEDGPTQRREELHRQQADLQRKITALIDSLPDFAGGCAADHVKQRIEELHAQKTSLEEELRGLEQPPEQRTLPTGEFRLLRRQLALFRDCADQMTVDQKRAGVHALVQKVLWDGACAHVFLLGTENEAILQSPENTHLCEDSK